MNVLSVVFAAIAGGAVGWVYFRGLLATVERLPGARSPAVWLVASFLLRALLALALFMFAARFAGWPGLLAALAGFIGARTVLVRRAPTRQP